MRALLRRLGRSWHRLWSGVVWEVCEVLEREERAAYEEEQYFAEVLSADPRREDPPPVVLRTPRHAADGEADHRQARGRGYRDPAEHIGEHRHWYDPDYLSPWNGDTTS